MRQFLRAKIHRATITEADLEYMGSVTIDSDLMKRVDIAPYERVLIVDNTNGARLETYAIEGPAGSGVLCINGAAAHLMKKGDQVILMAFGYGDMAETPKQILVGDQNEYLREIAPEERGVIDPVPAK